MPGYGRSKEKREKGKRAMPPDGIQVMASPHAGVNADVCRCRECVRHRLTHGIRQFNADGFCEDGYDRDGYDSEGRDIDGYDRSGRDEDGYDRSGYDADGLNADGYDADGYDEWGYDAGGYDAEGYNSGGFNADGYDRDGYNEDGYDEDGYDRDGYNEDGYNSEGYDRRGYDEDGYNYEGYNRNGYNRDGSCCASPQLEFAIRNGTETLACDTRVRVELPSGTISREGLNDIYSCLRSWNLYVPDLDEIGDQWQATTGNYTKRLSSHAYKKHGIKVPPSALTEIGNIARAHSTAASACIEVTRQLNMSSELFCNDDSCWWGGYSNSRCALKTNGGYALREFDEMSEFYGRVNGRAWVMPLKLRNGRLVPTFDALAPAALMSFNGYGSLSGYAAPRLLGYMTGWTYQKMSFSCEPMYINGCTGYLIAPEPLTRQYAGTGLSLDVSRHSRLFDNEQATTKKEESVNVSS